MHNSSVFSKRVRAHMRERHLTIRTLAETLKVSPATVQNWRNGMIPNTGHMIGLAAELRCSYNSLVEGIAVNKGDIAHWEKAPLKEVPAHIAKAAGWVGSPDYRKVLEETCELWMQTPSGVEMIRVPVAEVEKWKMGVDNNTAIRHSQIMRYTLADLFEEMRVLTEPYGEKAKLARHLGVKPQRINEWIAGTSKPTSEVTLALLYWVEERKRK